MEKYWVLLVFNVWFFCKTTNGNVTESACFAACKNRGKCVGSLYNPTCDCFKQFYEGRTCQIQTDNCYAFYLPICNRAKTRYCSSYFGGKQCHCVRGYTGSTCHLVGTDVAAAELGAYFTDHVSFTMDTSELWIWAANLGDIQSVNVNIDGWVTRIKRNEFENKSVELQTNRETYLKQATFLLSHSQVMVKRITVTLLHKARFMVYATAFSSSNIPFYNAFETQVRKAQRLSKECTPTVYMNRHSTSGVSNWVPIFTIDDIIKITMSIEPDCENYTKSTWEFNLHWKKHIGGVWRIKNFDKDKIGAVIPICKDKPSCAFKAKAVFGNDTDQTYEITAVVTETPKNATTRSGIPTILQRVSGNNSYRRSGIIMRRTATDMNKGTGYTRAWVAMGEKPDIRGYIKGGVNRAHFYEDNLTIQISQKAENKMRWLCQCSDSAKPCPKPCLEGYEFSSAQIATLDLNTSLANKSWDDWITIQVKYDFLPDQGIAIGFNFFIFKEKRPALEISCLRNCYPQTNYREYTILVGKCVKYCEGEDSLFTNQGWLLDSELIRHPIDLPEKILCVRLREDFDLEEALLEEKEIMAIFRSSSGGWAEYHIFHHKLVRETPIPFYMTQATSTRMKTNPCVPQPRLDSQVCLLSDIPRDAFVYYIAYQINEHLYKYDKWHTFAVGVILDYGGSYAFRPVILANVPGFTRVNVMNNLCFEIIGPYLKHVPTVPVVIGREPASQQEKADLLEKSLNGTRPGWYPSTRFSSQHGDISTFVQKISFIANEFSLLLGETVDEQNYVWNKRITILVEALRQFKQVGKYIRTHLDLLQTLSLLNEIIRLQPMPVHPKIINLIGKRYREFTDLHLQNVEIRLDVCVRVPTFFELHFENAFRSIAKFLYHNSNEELLLDGMSFKTRYLAQNEIPVDIALETGIKEKYALYRDLAKTWPTNLNKYRRGTKSAIRAVTNMLRILAVALLDKKEHPQRRKRETRKRPAGYNYLPGVRYHVEIQGTHYHAFVQVADTTLLKNGIVLGEFGVRLIPPADTSEVYGLTAIAMENNAYWWGLESHKVNSILHVKVYKCANKRCDPTAANVGVQFYDLPQNTMTYANLASYPTQRNPDLKQKFSFTFAGESGHALIQITQPHEILYVNMDVKLVVNIAEKMYVLGKDRPLTIVIKAEKDEIVEGTISWKKALIPGIEAMEESKERKLGAVVQYGIQIYKISCYKFNSSNSKWIKDGTPWHVKLRGFECKTKTTADVAPNTYSYEAQRIRVSFGGTRSLFFDYDVEDETLLFHILAVILLIWLFMFVSAIILDVTDHTRNRTHFLIDNRVDEKYIYHVIVATGTRSGAGTTAHIGIKIYGTESNSKRHILHTTISHTKLLQRGRKDWFLMTTAEPLGRIVAVELWSDHYGNSPDWFCSKVIVRDYNKYNERGEWVEQACWVEPEWPDETESELARQMECDQNKLLPRAKTFLKSLIPEKTPSQIEAQAKKKQEKADKKAEAERLKKEEKEKKDAETAAEDVEPKEGEEGIEESESAKRLEGGQDEEEPKREDNMEPGDEEEEHGPPRPTKRVRRTMKDGRPIKPRRLKRTLPSGKPIPPRRLKRKTPEGYPVPTRRNLYRKDGSAVNPNQCSIEVDAWFSLTRNPRLSHGVAEYYTRPPLTIWERLYQPGDLDTRHLWLGSFTKECGALDRKSKVWILLAMLVVPLAVIMNHLGTGYLPTTYHKHEYICHWVYFFSNSNLYRIMPHFEGIWNAFSFHGGDQDIINIEYPKLISAFIVSEIATIVFVYPAFYTLR